MPKKKKWEADSPEGVTVENTKENRIPQEHLPQQKREQRAALELELSKLRCRHCNSVGNWKIVKTAETLRYVQCGVCSRTSAIPTKGPITKTLRSSDIKNMQDNPR